MSENIIEKIRDKLESRTIGDLHFSCEGTDKIVVNYKDGVFVGSFYPHKFVKSTESNLDDKVLAYVDKFVDHWAGIVPLLNLLSSAVVTPKAEAQVPAPESA